MTKVALLCGIYRRTPEHFINGHHPQFSRLIIFRYIAGNFIHDFEIIESTEYSTKHIVNIILLCDKMGSRMLQLVQLPEFRVLFETDAAESCCLMKGRITDISHTFFLESDNSSSNMLFQLRALKKTDLSSRFDDLLKKKMFGEALVFGKTFNLDVTVLSLLNLCSE